jgi:hypothetical protein
MANKYRVSWGMDGEKILLAGLRWMDFVIDWLHEEYISVTRI